MIPKTVIDYAERHNLAITVLTFKFGGTRLKRKGYCIHRKVPDEKGFYDVIFELEPISSRYSFDYHWKLTHHPWSYKGRCYFIRITKKILEAIPRDEEVWFKLKK